MADGVGGIQPGSAGAGAIAGSPRVDASGPVRSGDAPSGAAGSPAFDAILQQQGGGADIQFSRHALRRIEQRGLTLDADRMRRLSDAVGQAEQKGSKDSLVLLDELALVVSVQNHTVVTAMDGNSQKGNVFTNIDSVVIAH